MLLNGVTYKDSESKQQSIRLKYQQILLSKANVGDSVYFGTYEQDNDTSNGKEAIEWTVLDRDGTSLLLISKKGLDAQPYNPYTEVTWESSSLREWLNATFFNDAFSSEEQSQIQSTNVSADENPEFRTDPGNATTDKVFSLSINEAEQYFASDSTRQCEATEYAAANGVIVNSVNDKCSWWLRSPGFCQDAAAYIDSPGSIECFGHQVYYDFHCVRPALWVNLDL